MLELRLDVLRLTPPRQVTLPVAQAAPVELASSGIVLLRVAGRAPWIGLAGLRQMTALQTLQTLGLEAGLCKMADSFADRADLDPAVLRRMPGASAVVALHGLSTVLGHVVEATALCALRGLADQIGVAYLAALPALDYRTVVDVMVLLAAECTDQLDRAVSVQVTEGEAAEASNPLAIVDRVTGLVAVPAVRNLTIDSQMSGSPAALTDQLRSALPSGMTDGLAALANHSRTFVDVMTLLGAKRTPESAWIVLLLLGGPDLPATEDGHFSGHCSG